MAAEHGTDETDEPTQHSAPRFTRRRVLLASACIGVGLAGSALLAACGGDDDDDGDDAATPEAATATTAAAAATSDDPTATTGAAQASPTVSAAAPTATSAAGAGAASPTTATTGSATGPWSFTDGRGVTIDLDALPTRIVAEVTAAASLWDLGIRPVGIYGVSRDASGAPAAQAGQMDLDAVTSLGEEWGVMDVEALLALNADVIIDQDWGDGLLAGLSEEAQGLIPDSMPTLCVEVHSSSLLEVIEQYEALAVALGADLQAPDVVAARETYDASVEDLRAAIEAKPDLTIMFASALTDGLYVAHPEAAADLRYYTTLGMDIIAHPTPEDFWELLSWEQVNRYEVDVIFLDARAGYERPEEFADIATWEQLPAVVADQIAPWYFDLPYTRATVQTILDGMTEVLTNAEDVV